MIRTFAISGLVNGLLSLAFGFFIIIHNWRFKLNRIYFFLTVSVGFWALSYWQWLSAVNEADALFWVRMLSIGSVLIPVFYFHWIVSFLELNKKYKISVRLAYILAGFLLCFSFSSLFVKGVERKLFFPFWPEPGIFYHFYLLFVYVSLTVYSFALLIRHYRSSTKEKRGQIIYVLVGSIVAFSGGASNFFLWYNIPIPPYGSFLIALFPLLFGYAMMRHKLFNIRIITTELFTFGIWAALFVKVLLSPESVTDLLVNISIFVWSLIFGIFLIRSVIHEVEQKNKIEVMAADVGRAYEIEKQARQELERLDEARSQFTMATQHHLRTPLTIVKGYLSMVLEGDFGKVNVKVKEKMSLCLEAVERLIQLANEFLDISKIQLGKDIINLEKVLLSDLLGEVLKEVSPEAKEKGISLEMINPEKFVLPVSVDPMKFKEALFNIIDNAIKYTQEGGVKVSVELLPESAPENFRIIIADTGVGMTKEETKTIFNRQFERGKSGKSVYALGRGIGLFLAAKIIAAHKGKVWADSEGPKKGSVFYIETPIN